jgi:pimeloyl-ACP methyl ester carboxylesterase
MGDRAERWVRTIEAEGVEAWASQVVAARMGEGVRDNDLAGWAELMAESDRETLLGLLRSIPAFDATGDLERVACPTLIMTADACPAMPLDATLAWQRRIGGSELRVFNGIGEHVAASHAREAATAALDFYRKDAQRKAEEARRDRGDRERRREARQRGAGGGGGGERRAGRA